MHACIDGWMCVCVCVCVCVYVHTWVYMTCMYVCMYVCMCLPSFHKEYKDFHYFTHYGSPPLQTHAHTCTEIGAPGLAVGSTIAINILPSDDAFGVFSFDTGSLARVVEEQAGGTPVTLTVVRSGGSFGDIAVYWQVEGPGGDIAPGQGTVEFAEGEMTGELEVTVADDLVRGEGFLFKAGLPQTAMKIKH